VVFPLNIGPIVRWIVPLYVSDGVCPEVEVEWALIVFFVVFLRVVLLLVVLEVGFILLPGLVGYLCILWVF